MDDVNSLLAKFIAGDAAPEEAIVVNNWIAASEENKLYYRQVEKAWSLDSKELHTSPDKDRVWAELAPLLKRDQNPGRRLWTYRIAAGILIVSGAVTFYLLRISSNENNSPWNSEQTSNEVANLNLPDGSAVTVNRNSLIQWPGKPADSIREVRLK